jgi:hypothetical protein
MKAGFPGAGIGYVFYFLLVVLMPFDELRRTLQRRSSRQRWRRVGRQSALVAGIFAALYTEWWGLAKLHTWVVSTWDALFPAPVVAGDAAATATVQPFAFEHYFAPVTALAFVIVAVLCIGLQLVRLIVRCEPMALVRRSLVRLRS